MESSQKNYQKLFLTFVALIVAILPVFVCADSLNPKTLESKNIEKILSEIDLTYDVEVLKENLPRKHLRDARLFWQAYRDYQNKNYKTAKRKFTKIKKRKLFKKYTAYFLAKIAFHYKKYQDIVELLPSEAKRFRKIDWDCYWLRLEALAHLKKSSSVQAELKTLSKIELKDRFTIIRKNFILGLLHFQQKQKTKAYKYFAAVLVQNPGSEYDEHIFELLKDHKISIHKVLPRSLLILRAENLIQTGLADWGYKIYEDLSRSKDDYLEEKALALFRGRRYEEAAQSFQRLLKTGKSSLSRLRILTYLGQCYSRTDQFQKAIANVKKIKKEFPQSRSAANSSYQLAFLYYDSNQFEKAAKAFEKFLPKGSKRSRSRSVRNRYKKARWYRFWSYYLDKKYKEAEEEAIQALKENPRDDDYQKALTYFLGRTYEKRKLNAKAKKQYQKLMIWDEHDYYRLMASQRLHHKNLQHNRLAHEKLFHSVKPIQKQKFYNDIDAKVLRDNDSLLRAFVFFHLGLNDYAFHETLAVQDQARTNYGIATILQNIGNSRLSFAAGYAARAGRIAGCAQDCAFYLRFPLAYKNYVIPYSKLWNLDPYLPYAIMRQESAFLPDVVSSAYAYGLMQIIPPTGQEIADEISYSDFKPPELSHPKLNTLFGTYYLKKLLTKFDNELVPAIASYNAGPYNVGRWLKKDAHNEWDEFIELIPYSETKKYTKRVLVNYWLYVQLYPDLVQN